jgi:hypothetical protein
MFDQATQRWAREEFGHAQLGDERRTKRLVQLAAGALDHPAGRITEVFGSDAKRQGAYDFLESHHVSEAALSEAVARASARRVADTAYAFVALDGTSLSLVDRKRAKDFGAVGSYTEGGRGLKIIHAYITDKLGVPAGVCGQAWWTRPDEHVRRSPSRKLHEKETVHWLEVIEQTSRYFSEEAEGTRPWFQIDREGDCWSTLRRLIDRGELFTVRSSWNRRLKTKNGEPRAYLREALQKSRVAHTIFVDVPAKPGRRARRARLEIRARQVTLDLKNSWTKVRYKRPVNVLSVKERGTTPSSEKPLEWLLLTSHAIETKQDLELVVFGYTQRWRIEELHRTWKSGGCRVEETQLRTKSRVIKWATVMVAVAARIERLKYLARQRPDTAATVELTENEILALLLLKRTEKKRNETIPAGVPTIAQATRWIADLGGYTGKSSGGPPGTITLKRGLNRLATATKLIEATQL